MRRWWLRIILVVGAASLALAVRNVQKVRVQKERDAHNQLELRKYSQNLELGLTRKEVKDYLQAQGTKFGERCCDEGFRAFAVIVKVGEEDRPWYCSEWPVYVAFEFVAIEPYKFRFPVDPEVLKKVRQYGLELSPVDSDVLTKVQLASNGEGCL
jgi:hypothetical protein